MKNSLILLFALLITGTTSFGQGTGTLFPFKSYYEFDLEGGYYPGSFIVLRKKSPQTPLITRERLEKVVCVKQTFEYTDPVSIPNTTLDRKKTFQMSLDLSIKYEAVSPSLKNTLKKAKTVSLKVDKGKRYFLKSGAISLQDIIYALPQEELTRLKFELDNNNKLYLITEVLEYEEAQLVLHWDNDISAGLQAEIPLALKLGTENKWTDNGTLIVKFASGQVVGYKRIEVNKAYKKLIEERIQYRQEHGDDRCMYPDVDGDGFGDANVPCKCVPSKQSLNGYVTNAEDCYDHNSNAHPGQTNFYTLNRGDGSFDYDCDGNVTLQYNNNGRCQGCAAAVQGWDGPIPKAGQTGQYIIGCNCNHFCRDCDMQRVAKTQGGL